LQGAGQKYARVGFSQGLSLQSSQTYGGIHTWKTSSRILILRALNCSRNFPNPNPNQRWLTQPDPSNKKLTRPVPITNVKQAWTRKDDDPRDADEATKYKNVPADAMYNTLWSKGTLELTMEEGGTFNMHKSKNLESHQSPLKRSRIRQANRSTMS